MSLLEEERCANCQKTDLDLKSTEGSLKTCVDCNIAKYCCRDCQLKDRPKHKHFCVKLKKLPKHIGLDDIFEIKGKRGSYKTDFFQIALKKSFYALNIAIECKSKAPVEKLLKATEDIVCLTWDSPFPCFRYFIPPLLLHLDRFDDAYNCAKYLLLDYGKDLGRSLGDLSESMLVENLPKHNKYEEAFIDELGKCYQDGNHFGLYNCHIWNGILILVLICIKMKNKRDYLKQVVEGGDQEKYPLMEEQGIHFGLYMGLLLSGYKEFYDLLVHDKQLEFKNMVIRGGADGEEENKFFYERVHAFAHAVCMKIKSVPGDVNYIKQLYARASDMGALDSK